MTVITQEKLQNRSEMVSLTFGNGMLKLEDFLHSLLVNVHQLFVAFERKTLSATVSYIFASILLATFFLIILQFRI